MGDRIEYQDFEVDIQKNEDGTYQAMIHSQGGRIDTRFAEPFSADRRALYRQTLTTAALRSSARVRSSSAAEVKTMRDLGATLFGQVMQDNIKDFYNQCYGKALSEGKGLRIRLSVDPALGDLPWEFLCSPQKEFLALNPKTPVVRYIKLSTPVAPLKVSLPLSLLVVIASPRNLMPLDTAAEKVRINTALASLESQGMIRVSYIEGPDTWSNLIDALRPDETHILHFIGHGQFDEQSGEGLLVMEDMDGNAELIGSDRIHLLFQGHDRLRLAVLNSCLGAQASESEPLSSVAAAMVRAGIPAVIAMQFEVSDNAAQTIASAFYKSLALNFPVDAALTEARRQIALTQPDSLEWATPVLIMQVPDGQLFDISSKQPELQKQINGSVTTGQMKNVVELMYQRGEKLYQAQNWPEALKSYRSAAALNPDYKQVAQRIAEIEAILSGSGVASALPNQGLPPAAPEQDLNARAAERYKAGQEAYARGDWEAAVKGFRGALLLVPNYRDAEKQLAYCERRNQCVRLYAQARQLYEDKKYRQVIETLTQLRQADPRWVDSADLQVLSECGETYQQALAALRAGQKERGAELLRNIYARRPDFEDVIARLENLAEGSDGLFGETARPATLPVETSERPNFLPPAGPGLPSASSQPAPSQSFPAQPAYPLPTPSAPPVQNPPPANQRIYELRNTHALALAEEIKQWFLANGFQTQIIRQDPTLMIQGKKDDLLRSLVGMANAATVILEQADTTLKTSVGGGKWVDKAAVAAFGMFVAFGFTVLTAGVGAAQQKQLENNLLQMIERHILSRGGQRLS